MHCQEDPSRPRKALLKAAKRQVTDEDDDNRLTELQSLPRQGHMIRSTSPDTASIWATAVQSLPEDSFKFVLNAAHDTLPHNANLHDKYNFPVHIVPTDLRPGMVW